MFRILFFLAVFIFPFVANTQTTAKKNDINTYLSPVKYRNIGPFRGGRSVSASGVVGDPITYYMGTTGGGLWKTEDAGQHWNNISDGYFTTGSVGAVAVSESNPNVVYCGMGEHAPRGVMTSHGDGMYKSTDAGKTWKKIGLEKTQHIARIVIDPNDPDIVFVAAQGALHAPNRERGIYKSTDGGESWKQVLFVNSLTGCSELSMDMQNPQVMYAAMWEHQRKSWIVISGGEGSGLYKSIDGGERWEKMENGLPDVMGKMAIAVSRANPDKVWALIESDWEKELGGLYVSNNAGKSWSQVSNDHRLVQRSWYYIEVFADPLDEETVYVLSAPALRSIDGGKTWERLSGTHGDYHDLWINPEDSKNLCIANDGGAAISFNYGRSWSTQANMPTAQFYRVNVDNQFPYRIYGGQQDNTSISIASRELGSWSIGPKSWTRSAGGESAFLAFDPDEPNLQMGGSYLGTIELYDQKAKAGTNIMAAPIQYLGMEARQMKYLYNWNAPIIKSQHEPNTYYHAAQLLLRTRDNGITWEEASPDLTRNQDDKQGNGGGPITNEAVGAENYGTISYVIESPHEAGVIWTGSDDGLVQLTKDNGANWQNVTPKGLKECLINAIDISPHDPATAYIATTRYKFDDKTPAIYKTTNYGATWTNISNGIPQGAYTRVVREDNKRKDLLFAGTETGIYFSLNGGAAWQTLQLNMPITPILDMIIRHDDLVIATSGRSFWILDDMGLLRQLPSDGAELGTGASTTSLFQPEPTYLVTGGSQLDSNNPNFDGTNSLSGVNPATGVVMYYHLPKLPDSVHIQMQILDKNGRLINEFSSERDANYRRWDGGPGPNPSLQKHAGLNRFVWNLRHRSMPGVENVYIEGSWRGHRVGPGTYTLKLLVDGNIKSTTFEVLANPLYPEDLDYEAYDEFMSACESELNIMHDMVNGLNDQRKQIQGIIDQLGDEKKYEALKANAELLIKDLKAWDEEMVQRKSKAYDDVENFPNKFTANYLFMINATESSIPRVNKASRSRKAELELQWKDLKIMGESFQNEKIPALNQSMWELGIGAIK